MESNLPGGQNNNPTPETVPPQAPAATPPAQTPETPGATPPPAASAPPAAQVAPENPPNNSSTKRIVILAVIILIVGALVAGGYYFIANMAPAPGGSVPVTTTTPAPEGEDTVSNAAPTPLVEYQTYTSEPIEGLSLLPYTITYPTTWTLAEDKTEVSSSITLANGELSIKIDQAPTGGNFCVFEGELPDGPATDYRESQYTEINAPFGVVRRAGDYTSYSFCQESVEEPGTFFLPTSIGFITYEVPEGTDEETLAEMDTIVSTITEAN